MLLTGRSRGRDLWASHPFISISGIQPEAAVTVMSRLLPAGVTVSVRLVTIAHWVPSLFCDTVLLKGRLKEERLTVPSYSYMLEGSHSGGSLGELVT